MKTKMKLIVKDLDINDFDLWIKENCSNNIIDGYDYKGSTYTKHKLFEIYKNERKKKSN